MRGTFAVGFRSGASQHPPPSTTSLVLDTPGLPRHHHCRPRYGRGDDAAHELAPRYLAAPILNIFVLQTEQVPSVAGRPFFIVINLGFLISR